jgi:CDP-diacylglycerol---serine O-phosphatidyltransferase
MKHLPNLLTLCNLICGCIAIAFALNSQPFRVMTAIPGEYYQVYGTEQAYWAGIFIGIAAICDLLDGFAARALNVFSPIGKDLDSLADVVSFGVAPSMILFKMLWSAYMADDRAMDVNMFAMVPAFLVACFAALRLARFNISSQQQKWSFTGLPVPAVGILVASFPLINMYNPHNAGSYIQGKWTIYLVIAVLCWLMVSKVAFFKLMPAKWQPKYMWPQIVLVIAAIATVPLLQAAAIPVLFLLYILLSFVYKAPQEPITKENTITT